MDIDSAVTRQKELSDMQDALAMDLQVIGVYINTSFIIHNLFITSDYIFFMNSLYGNK